MRHEKSSARIHTDRSYHFSDPSKPEHRRPAHGRCGMSAPVDAMKAADIAILRRLGNKYRSGRTTPEESAAFEAANDRQMARQRAASNQVRGWWDLPVARACWEGDARVKGGAA